MTVRETTKRELTIYRNLFLRQKLAEMLDLNAIAKSKGRSAPALNRLFVNIGRYSIMSFYIDMQKGFLAIYIFVKQNREVFRVVM